MFDLKWTDDFDLSFEHDSSNKTDISRCEDEAAYAQVITNRLKSVSPDWFYDNKGADLELLLGEPNTRETAEYGVNQIRGALCGDGLVPKEDLYIKPVPVNADTVIFFCFVKNPYQEGKFTFQTEICLSGKANIVFIKS